jgi:hypothetical protein
VLCGPQSANGSIRISGKVAMRTQGLGLPALSLLFLPWKLAAAADFLDELAFQFVSQNRHCVAAAEEAKASALRAGIALDRLQWLYTRKPFETAGHVVLLIDGRVVVDNGGLGRNLWGDRVCPGNVCTMEEVRRAADEHFVESASLAIRNQFAQSEWRVAVADEGDRQ